MALELDATALRKKYGEPLARETFQVRPNIQIVVSYGRSNQVCRIEFPIFFTRQELEEVIDELVSPSERGKEIGHSRWIFGGYSVSNVEYENIIISEREGGITAVTIIFRRPDCNSPDPSQYHEA
jgi:hypothetical protein